MKELLIVTLINKNKIDEATNRLQVFTELFSFINTVLLYFFIGTVLLSIISLPSSVNKGADIFLYSHLQLLGFQAKLL